MTFRFVLAMVCALSLAACGALDDSPLEQEQTVKIAPGDAYVILDSAMRMVAAANAGEALKMVTSSDGYQEIRISYVLEGREIITQKFNMLAGSSPSETKLRLTMSAAPTATPEDRRKFALIKKEQARRFEQFSLMLNSKVMADMLSGVSGGFNSPFPDDFGPDGDDDQPDTRSLSGTQPEAQNPTPSSEASAPEMSTAPTLNTRGSNPRASMR